MKTANRGDPEVDLKLVLDHLCTVFFHDGQLRCAASRPITAFIAYETRLACYGLT